MPTVCTYRLKWWLWNSTRTKHARTSLRIFQLFSFPIFSRSIFCFVVPYRPFVVPPVPFSLQRASCDRLRSTKWWRRPMLPSGAWRSGVTFFWQFWHPQHVRLPANFSGIFRTAQPASVSLHRTRSSDAFRAGNDASADQIQHLSTHEFDFTTVQSQFFLKFDVCSAKPVRSIKGYLTWLGRFALMRFNCCGILSHYYL